ncbi:hypothetical protein, partial [Corynebacterium stationis]|uniref:hypothetical protein n=1 Tax=Corynebacterium stationis TaxID=1705 RepID=UPI00339CDA4D
GTRRADTRAAACCSACVRQPSVRRTRRRAICTARTTRTAGSVGSAAAAGISATSGFAHGRATTGATCLRATARRAAILACSSGNI